MASLHNHDGSALCNAAVGALSCCPAVILLRSSRSSPAVVVVSLFDRHIQACRLALYRVFVAHGVRAERTSQYRRTERRAKLAFGRQPGSTMMQ